MFLTRCRDNTVYFKELNPVFPLLVEDDEDSSCNNYWHDLQKPESVDKIEDMFDKFERFSNIYITQHENKIHFIQNQFKRNMGSSGGAITINAFLGENPELGEVGFKFTI